MIVAIATAVFSATGNSYVPGQGKTTDAGIAVGREPPGMTILMSTEREAVLTPREREVATLLAYGHTNTEIAERLAISVRTAEMHRANAMRKLTATTRADVVRWALDHELLH